MTFSSAPFLFFFLPAAAPLYRLIPGVRRKNLFLALAGLVFYAFGQLSGLPLLLLSALVTYLSGLLAARPRWGRAAVAGAVVCHLAVLLAFKYLDFFALSLGGLLGRELPVLGWALPLGVSFFTFKGISYAVDVRRGDCQASRSFLDVLLYLSFFPEVTAGPISRFGTFAPQLEERRAGSRALALGLRRFIVGLGKKVLLSAPAAAVAGEVFALGDGGDLRTAWLGALACLMEIYFDFSGYSDMAIGLAAMFGFTSPENFRYPYAAASITEFWRRWHLSLSLWFRDYVYIPLGGSRRGRVRTYLNKFLVFLLSGLWHGASWTFVLWGVWHGVFAALESALGVGRKGKAPPPRPLRALGHVYTLIVAALGFVLFRAGSLGEAWPVLRACFTGVSLTGEASLLLDLVSPAQWLALAVGAAASLPAGSQLARKLTARNEAAAESVSFLLAASLFCLCLLAVAAGGFESFIYAQF